MARSYATIDVGMVRDDDWRALSVGAKAVYQVLIVQADIQACGVLPLTLRRWSKALNDDDRPHLAKWLNELGNARFIVIDKETEELFVRSFPKWDGGYKNQNRCRAVIASAEAVQSPTLRAVLRVELAKLGLHDCPSPDPTRIHPRPVPDPTPPEPRSDPDRTPSQPRSDADRTASEPLRSVVTKVDTDRTPHSENLGGEPDASNDANPTPPNPWCTNHPGGTDTPCAPCGRARTTRTQWDTDRATYAAQIKAEARRNERTRRAQAITDCNLCDHTGYRLLDGRTGGVCNHQPLNPGALNRARQQLAQQETEMTATHPNGEPATHLSIVPEAAES